MSLLLPVIAIICVVCGVVTLRSQKLTEPGYGQILRVRVLIAFFGVAAVSALIWFWMLLS